MKVSIITPTYGREKFHSRILQCFKHQTYRNIEWLILDDSPIPSPVFANRNLPNILYTHVTSRMTIGDKRNWLAERSSGEVIAHFDDDDYYSPSYIYDMLAFLQSNDLDFVNLRGWFLYDKRANFFGYWNLKRKTGVHFVCDRDGVKLANITEEGHFIDNEIGWGFSFLYRKEVLQQIRFPSQNGNEDVAFSRLVHNKFRADGFTDTAGICIHELHGENTSRCFPQFRIPSFIMPRIFAEYTAA